MHEQKNEPQQPKRDEAKRLHYPNRKKITALEFDRDKNLFYLASDESIEEVLDNDGYHVVHANRNK